MILNFNPQNVLQLKTTYWYQRRCDEFEKLDVQVMETSSRVPERRASVHAEQHGQSNSNVSKSRTVG